MSDFAADTADGGPGVVIGTPLKRESGTPQLGHRRRRRQGASPSATRSTCRTMASSTRSASSRPARTCRDRSIFAACGSAFRSARTSGASSASARRWPRAAPRSCWFPNGSPYYRGKADVRQQVVIRQVIETGLPLLYANQLGGQDELVFDGASFAINADKSLAFQMSQFEETRGRHRPGSATARRLGLRRRADVEDPRDARRPTIAPACSACATMSTRTASGTSCSACRAASIRRSAPRWPSMRSARSGCAP